MWAPLGYRYHLEMHNPTRWVSIPLGNPFLLSTWRLQSAWGLFSELLNTSNVVLVAPLDWVRRRFLSSDDLDVGYGKMWVVGWNMGKKKGFRFSDQPWATVFQWLRHGHGTAVRIRSDCVFTGSPSDDSWIRPSYRDLLYFRRSLNRHSCLYWLLQKSPSLTRLSP